MEQKTHEENSVNSSNEQKLEQMNKKNVHLN